MSGYHVKTIPIDHSELRGHKCKVAYHPHGKVFHVHAETTQIIPVEDEVRANAVEEIVKRRGVFANAE